MRPKYHVGDKVMITIESLLGLEGVIIKILDRRFKENPNGSKFMIYVESTNSTYSMHALQFELINHEEDEKNETGYYSEAAQEILSKQPLYRPGDVVHVENDIGGRFYVIEEATLVQQTIRGGLYPMYYYKMNKLDDGRENFKPETCMCEEAGLEFQYHDTQWEKYFTEGNRQDGLPAWRGELYNLFACYLDFNDKDGLFDSSEVKEHENDTIPVQFMEHIIKKHSVYGMIKRVLGNRCTTESAAKIREMFKLSSSELIDIMTSMLNELDAINATGADRKYHNRCKNSNLFEDNEWDVLLQIDKLDIVGGNHVDHYPATMTNLQIMDAIKEAYESAHKEGAIEIGSGRDLRTGENITEVEGHQEYVGRSVTHDMTICFLYSRDMNLITTAYPTSNYIDHNAKKQ